MRENNCDTHCGHYRGEKVKATNSNPIMIQRYFQAKV